MSNSIFWLSFYKIFGLLLLIFLLKLVNQPMVNSVLTLFLAFLAIRSPKPLFWFTFAFIYSNSPGGLFDTYTFGLSAGSVVIDLVQIITIALVANVMNKKQSIPVFFNLFLISLSLLIIVNIVLGIFSGIDDAKIFMRILKVILPFALIPVGLRVFRQKDDFLFFFKLIFPFVFLAFLSQLYIYASGTPLATIIFGQETFLGTDISTATNLSRYVFSVFLLSAAFMGALFYLGSRQKVISNIYLASIVFTVLISFIVSGTRAWALGFSLIFILWVLTVSRRIAAAIPLVFVSVVFVIALANLVPNFSTQLEMAYERLLTVELLAEGDITAGGTLKRFDVRAPILMSYFLETNLLLGAGYSQFMFDHQDPHIGHHNTLFQVGIIGVLILYSMFLSMMFRLVKIYKLQPGQWESAYAIFSIMLLGMLFIQTSVQVFSFTPMPENGTFYALLFAFGNFSYQMAINKQV